jgi:hypothetical protein
MIISTSQPTPDGNRADRDGLRASGIGPFGQADVEPSHPGDRRPRPEEIAHAVAFLVLVGLLAKALIEELFR